MDNKAQNIDWIISNFNKFEKSLNGQSESAFHKIRKNAFEKFRELDFPTRKNEEWKYTPISPILNYNFAEGTDRTLSISQIKPYLIKKLKVSLIVMLNGKYHKELSRLQPEAEGVLIDSFENALISKQQLITDHFSKYAELRNGFIALNTAFARDGVVIVVPEEMNIENPVHILNISGEGSNNVIAQPRNLVLLGKNSHAKFIESYHSISGSPNFSNVVTEIVIGENSYLEHYKIQEENTASFHINWTQVEQKNGSNFTTYTVSLGGAITRNDLDTVLDGENCQANLYGLYLIDGTQHIDNHTLIDHAKPNCQSNELYKGVLNNKSRGVFNGKVFVRKDAQKTNAYQSNKAILLSKEAMVDTKPQLEIYADDVKCSHGAAIGQLDDESVFYLRSRGIGEEMAKAVLVRAFANDVFDEIKLDALHGHLNELVHNKLN